MDIATAFPIEVTEDDEGMRVDQFLALQFDALSRSRWTRLIEAGAILLDGKVASPSQRIKVGQKVDRQSREKMQERLDGLAELFGDTEAKNEPVVFRGQEPGILFEDDDFAVLNKPCGLTVHPGAGIPIEETVAGWLLATGRVASRGKGEDEQNFDEWEEDVLDQRRPGIVHRLDRGTSGALVVAKNPSTHAALSAQFADRTAGRLYWAVVEGTFSQFLQKRPPKLEEMLGRVPCPVAFRVQTLGDGARVISLATRLERDPKDRVRFRVSPAATGRRAVTHAVEVSSSGKLALLECKLETGRTHQIRVHCSFLSLSILGDTLYGGREHRRTWLHAHNLRLQHPKTGEQLEFTAPFPPEDLAWLNAEGLKASSRSELWKELKSTSPNDGPKD